MEKLINCENCRYSEIKSTGEWICNKLKFKIEDKETERQCDFFVDENQKCINPKATQIFMLTFDEIASLYNEMQKIKNNDDYRMPIMMIRIEQDKEWEEKEYVSTMPLYQHTDILMNDKFHTVEERKKALEEKWIDINDEIKWDFI
jgi:hypothetical protein